MARFLTVNERSPRKRALVAESEVYRQSLRLQAQNLRLYGRGWRQRFSSLATLGPAAALVAPVAAAFVGRKRRGKLGLLSLALQGWRLYHRFGPTIVAATASYLDRRREKVQTEARDTRSAVEGFVNRDTG